MGFRSVFISEDIAIQWPDWFIDKYRYELHVDTGKTGSFHSPYEIKIYKEGMENFPSDIQKAIDWDSMPYLKQFLVIFLHECGGITRLHITKDSIRWSEPRGWTEIDGITHHYCENCGSLSRADHLNPPTS